MLIQVSTRSGGKTPIKFGGLTHQWHFWGACRVICSRQVPRPCTTRHQIRGIKLSGDSGYWRPHEYHSWVCHSDLFFEKLVIPDGAFCTAQVENECCTHGILNLLELWPLPPTDNLMWPDPSNRRLGYMPLQSIIRWKSFCEIGLGKTGKVVTRKSEVLYGLLK